MYFSKLELSQRADTVASAAHRLTQNGYRLHQLLWQLFADSAEQPQRFLYRRINESAWPAFYMLSEQPPLGNSTLWQVQTKAYRPRLTAGSQLAFSLCANPTVTKTDASGKSVRHDVVMDAKKAAKVNNEQCELSDLIQQAGLTWLEKRAHKHGFQLRQTRVDGYRQHRLVKSTTGQPIRFSTLDFQGVLTIIDPELFLQTLFKGIGSAKGFGCGLMLIRRA